MAYVSPKDGTAKPKSAKRSTPAGVRLYLLAYNLVSALGWAYVLYILVAHLANIDVPKPSSSSPAPTLTTDPVATVTAAVERVLALLFEYLPFLRPTPASVEEHIEASLPDAAQPLWARAKTAFGAVGPQTALVQSAAALEVVHALLGWVRSPLPTTAMQVASRLFLVWGVADRFETARANPLYASMVLAWSATEVIRYVFYAFSLIGLEPRPLVWLRYTTFYVLYPLGAGSEAFLTLSTLPRVSPLTPEGRAAWAPEDYVRGALFLIWWPGLYVMYTHMMKQRRKVLGGQKLGSKKKTQ